MTPSNLTSALVSLAIALTCACGPTQTKKQPEPVEQPKPKTTKVVQPVKQDTTPKKPAPPAPNVLDAQKSRQALAKAAIEAIQANKIDTFKSFIIDIKDAQYYCGETIEKQNPEYLERRYKELKEKLPDNFGKCTNHDWSTARLIERAGIDTPSNSDCKGRKNQYYVRHTYRLGQNKNVFVNFQVTEFSKPSKTVISGFPYCSERIIEDQ